LTDAELTDWRCGRRLSMPDGPEESIVVCDADGEIVGIGLREQGEQLRPKVVFGAAG
jgi:tRNA pseudouridine55 synthase